MNTTFLKWTIIICQIFWMVKPLIAQDHAEIFKRWDDVIHANGSEYFFAEASQMHSKDDYINNHPWLNEEILFVQSNTRILTCQNPKGELRYIAMPIQVYPLPTSHGIPNGPNYGPGMYYHFDAIKLYNLKYTFLPSDSDTSLPLISEDQSNKTHYANHFLPVTKGKSGDIESTLISFAPVSPDPEKAVFSPAPLPGFPGVFYLLHIKNNGTEHLKGSILLSCEKKLHDQSARRNIDRNTLILTIPEASAGIHLVGGEWTENQDNHIASKDISLKPGDSMLIETIIVLGELYKDIMPVVYAFLMKESLDWLNLTAGFWDERIGHLTVRSHDFPQITEISRDIYYRCIIDNFCCLQTDNRGQLLAHYQGVPKQGTIWGIDYEPTIISAMHIAPELGKAGIKFTMNRNRPPRTEYGNDHSVPILVSPVMIARKYLEFTEDLKFFKENPDIMVSLDQTMKDLLSLKASEYDLFPTRYSSDGPTGRRYDHGTNVKVFYALEGFGYILDALGKTKQAQGYYKLAEGVSTAIDQTMVIDGPFGAQYSGGTNLDEEHGEFYLHDSISYYDGEDTGSHLGPIYGAYGWTHEPWINYHRWARSVLCPWYEPEFGTMRWFPSWSMPVLDGTGWISTLGGCATRQEMAHNMEQLYRICDPSGSLYWWPFGLNFKQGLSRCSQGQGAWAWQYLEQWLGIHVDALSHTLTFAPRGLPTRLNWQKMQIGNHFFDIFWEETASKSSLEIMNHNADPWTVRFGCRPFGSGVTETMKWEQFTIGPGQKDSRSQQNSIGIVEFDGAENIIAKVELERLGNEDGIVFIRYGTIDPFPEWYHLWEEEALDIRFYLLNGTDHDWKEVRVSFEYPEGWFAQPREPGIWGKPDHLKANSAVIMLDDLPSGKNAVAPFILKGPFVFDHDYLTSGLSKHYPAEQWIALQLPTKEINAKRETHCKAVLNAVTDKGTKIVKELIIPVTMLPIEE